MQTPTWFSASITSYILIGGRGSRLGQAKHLAMVNGQPLWQRTSQLLQSTLGQQPVFVGMSSNADLHRGFKKIPDALPDKGPLGGLVALLQDCPTSWALVMAVDMPYLSRREIRYLIANVDSNYQVIAFGQGNRFEPLAALYHRHSLPFWEHQLIREELSLQEGIRQLKHKQIPIPSGRRFFFNLNTPDDLIEAKQLAVGYPPS